MVQYGAVPEVCQARQAPQARGRGRGRGHSLQDPHPARCTCAAHCSTAYHSNTYPAGQKQRTMAPVSTQMARGLQPPLEMWQAPSQAQVTPSPL